MTIRNRIKNLVDGMSKTRYQFWKDTKLSQNTAYRLYDDPDYIPGPTVMNKICKAYKSSKVQPGDFIVYLPDLDEDEEDVANENISFVEPG